MKSFLLLVINEPITDAQPLKFPRIYNVLTRGGHLPTDNQPRVISFLAVNVLKTLRILVAST